MFRFKIISLFLFFERYRYKCIFFAWLITSQWYRTYHSKCCQLNSLFCNVSQPFTMGTLLLNKLLFIRWSKSRIRSSTKVFQSFFIGLSHTMFFLVRVFCRQIIEGEMNCRSPSILSPPFCFYGWLDTVRTVQKNFFSLLRSTVCKNYMTCKRWSK